MLRGTVNHQEHVQFRGECSHNHSGPTYTLKCFSQSLPFPVANCSKHGWLAPKLKYCCMNFKVQTHLPVSVTQLTNGKQGTLPLTSPKWWQKSWPERAAASSFSQNSECLDVHMWVCIQQHQGKTGWPCPQADPLTYREAKICLKSWKIIVFHVGWSSSQLGFSAPELCLGHGRAPGIPLGWSKRGWRVKIHQG